MFQNIKKTKTKLKPYLTLFFLCGQSGWLTYNDNDTDVYEHKRTGNNKYVMNLQNVLVNKLRICLTQKLDLLSEKHN